MTALPEGFTPHKQGPCPVPYDAIVIAMMDDGPLCAMAACEIDWDFPGDPVIGYKVVGADDPSHGNH